MRPVYSDKFMLDNSKNCDNCANIDLCKFYHELKKNNEYSEFVMQDCEFWKKRRIMNTNGNTSMDDSIDRLVAMGADREAIMKQVRTNHFVYEYFLNAKIPKMEGGFGRFQFNIGTFITIWLAQQGTSVYLRLPRQSCVFQMMRIYASLPLAHYYCPMQGYVYDAADEGFFDEIYSVINIKEIAKRSRPNPLSMKRITHMIYNGEIMTLDEYDGIMNSILGDDVFIFGLATIRKDSDPLIKKFSEIPDFDVKMFGYKELPPKVMVKFSAEEIGRDKKWIEEQRKLLLYDDIFQREVMMNREYGVDRDED